MSDHENDSPIWALVMVLIMIALATVAMRPDSTATTNEDAEVLIRDP